MSAYQYRGSGASQSPSQAAKTLARGGISPALATSREARAAEPVVRDIRPPATLKGAVKVAGFPSRYPFRQIAEDGGVWRIDPAEFPWKGKPTKDTSLRNAVMNWAQENGMDYKTVLDDGYVYVQFTRKGGGS